MCLSSPREESYRTRASIKEHTRASIKEYKREQCITRLLLHMLVYKDNKDYRHPCGCGGHRFSRY
jgi:hypothetical protein